MLPLREGQLEQIREHVREEHVPESRPGRKPLPTAHAQRYLLSQCYSNYYKTVHRRFQQWCERKVLREILTQLANTLRGTMIIDGRSSQGIICKTHALNSLLY